MLMSHRRIIISHVACERGYFWPFPYLEIDLNKTKRGQGGGCFLDKRGNGLVFSNYRQIQRQQLLGVQN